MGKKSKETSRTETLPSPASSQEIELLQRELDLANEQLESIGMQQDFQSSLFGQFDDLTEIGSMDQQVSEALGFSSEALQREADLAAGGATIDPQTEGFIDEIFQNQLASGESAVDRQVLDALRLVKQELAPSRGLRTSDTPITDRGFTIAGEGQRAKGDLINTLAAEAAASKLNFPLQQGALTSDRNRFLANFGNTLQQQAFNNRLNLINTTGNLGLGLANIGGNAGATALGLQQGRIASATTKTTDIEHNTAGDLISTAGTVIGVLGGVCWVAREVYGIDNPKWLLFRKWMLTDAPKWLLKLYISYGERFSEIIRPMPRVKSIIRYFMDKAIDGRT